MGGGDLPPTFDGPGIREAQTSGIG
jgi:hypothetical protein